MPKTFKPNTYNNTSTSHNNYYYWFITSFIIIICFTAILIWFGNNIFNKTMDAINKSNQKIVEKTGIEVSAELNQDDFLRTSQIINAKNSRLIPATNIRNVFLFNSYTGQTPKIIENINIEQNGSEI